MDLKKEQQIDLLLLLGTYKSFSEQLHNMKGLHSGLVKKKFNLLQNYVSNYEKQIDSTWLKDNQKVIEDLNDSITDMVYMIRENVDKQV
mgnify:FL=1|tara:strand:+ start:82 stop:348 length:267 start_codon:yes stop_codon:yes gene_type:complete